MIVVDDWFGRPLEWPWLSVAIDLATRCVMGIYLSMERPNAATVALLLSRVALPKAAWLDSLELEPQEHEVSWPMHGLPKALHLDNAAEFHGRALRMGRAQYGVELMYRPVGRPHFGAHVERMNRTLMERLRGLPGATGNSPKGCKARKPEETAALADAAGMADTSAAAAVLVPLERFEARLCEAPVSWVVVELGAPQRHPAL